MRARRSLPWWLVLIVLVAMGTSAVASSMLVEQLIFFPERAMPPPPAGVRERWLTTADGIRLHAWYAPASAGAPTLIWSHGNGGNIAGRAPVLLALQARGVNVLAYDYRGYGKSAGRPSESGVYGDVLAAYDSERATGTPAEQLIAFGESLGGAVSLHLASERSCAGIVVVSTFTTLRDVARRHFGPLAALAGGRFDSVARVRRLGVPLLVAHGDRDEIVPFELGEALYAAAPEPKRFLRVRGAHHNDVFASPALLDAIAAHAHAAAR